MKQYIETQSGSFTYEGMSIPNAQGNRHYAQLLAEVEAGEAEIVKFDHDAQAVKDKEVEERSWRNTELARADIEIYKAQDEGVSDTAWRTYRKQLRDYPNQSGFPNGDRPVAPDAV